MADRISDILDKIIESDYPAQTAKPTPDATRKTQSEHPRLADRKAAERSRDRRAAMERVKRVLNGGLDE